MMEAVRDWIADVVAITMLLSVAQALIPEGGIRRIFSFSGGLVLVVVLLRPILGIDTESLTLQTDSCAEQIQQRQEELEQNARAEWEAIIEQETAAYILEKADALGVEISAEVRAETGPSGLPVLSAELTGVFSELLAEYLTEELGIPRERQVWNLESKN